MRIPVTVVLSLVPAAVCGQYIGHPAGKTEPRGVTKPGVVYVEGMGGVEGGYSQFDVDATYDTTGGLVKETSTLKDLYFALYGGGHALGAELDATIGVTFPSVREGALGEDPFEDGTGVILGGSARWGFALLGNGRLGLGAQVMYSQSSGDTVLSDGVTSSLEGVELKLWRGDIFAGGGFDFALGSTGTFSPYLGAGLNLLDGTLTFKDYQESFPYQERMGKFRQDHLEFFFGGIDVFIMDQVRLGIEGRGNAAGWGAFFCLGWNF